MFFPPDIYLEHNISLFYEYNDFLETYKLARCKHMKTYITRTENQILSNYSPPSETITTINDPDRYFFWASK